MKALHHGCDFASVSTHTKKLKYHEINYEDIDQFKGVGRFGLMLSNLKC